MGKAVPSKYDTFEYYTPPFKDKIASVPISFNECQIIFFKGINDYYNLIGNDWSYGISFYTNDLLLEGTSNIYLPEYYTNYVDDYSRQLEGLSRENYIPAYFGNIPESPAIHASQFEVIQINTHLNSTQSNTDVIKTQQSIVTSKSNIERYRQTISDARIRLQSSTQQAERAQLQKNIDDNITKLSNETISYKSLVQTLLNYSKSNPEILVEPKYRIRGFFQIPNGTPINNAPNSLLEEIIQFEIQYRYIRNDGTASALSTHTFVDGSTGQKITGVYSDWIKTMTAQKVKTYNETSNHYEWATQNVGNGEEVNINQIDIPIQKGEKVQFKIRSISEAGWPLNPLKSIWSDIVEINFPAQLAAQNQIFDILDSANAEEVAIKLQDTLSTTGVDVHLADSVPNPNTGSGLYFKHQSRNLEVTKNTKDPSTGAFTQTSMSLQSFIDDIANNYYITVNTTTGSKSILLQTLLQQLVTHANL
jgi:hypothetical protein